jgi:PAS domain S-box-containing protein
LKQPLGLLLVDSDRSRRRQLIDGITAEGVDVLVREADVPLQAAIADEAVQCVLIVCERGSELEGAGLDAALTSTPARPTILLVEEYCEEHARAALRLGAQEVLPLGSLSPATLRRSIAHAVERHAARTAALRARHPAGVSSGRRRVLRAAVRAWAAVGEGASRMPELSGDPLFASDTWSVPTLELRGDAAPGLQERSELLHLATELAGLSVVDIDLESEVATFDERVLEPFGLDDATALDAETWLRHLHPDDEATARAAIAAGLDPAGDGRLESEHRIVRRDGATRWLSVHGRTFFAGEGGDRRAVRWVGTVADVTDRKQAHEELVRSAAIIRAVNENAPVLIHLKDRDGRLAYANPAVYEMVGVPPEQLLGTRAAEAIGPEQARFVREIEQRVMSSGAVETHEERLTTRFGPRHFLTTRMPYRDEAGRVIGTAGVAIDITERRRMEDELRRASAIVRTVNDNTPNLIYLKDREGRLLYGSPALYARFDVPPGAAGGEVAGPPYGPAVRETEQRVLESGVAVTLEEVVHTREGERVYLSSKAPFRDEKGAVVGIVGVSQDISDRKQMERELAAHRDRLAELLEAKKRELEESFQRLRMMDRMASIGTLSAGLGHDMGNLLFPIRARLDALEASPITDQMREDLLGIRLATDYLDQLTRGLRLLAGSLDRRAGEDERVSLGDWWQSMRPLLRNALPRSARLVAELHDPECALRMSPHAFSQAVFNLVKNAGDALQERRSGSVTVGSRLAARDGWVAVWVADDGPGMPSEVRERCLEPFFSTKPRGLSTGLGLALVHGAVQSAGGTIGIDSSVGAGTTFTLELPIADAAASPGR